MTEAKKPNRGRDTTAAKRQRELRATKPEIRAFLTTEQFAEVDTLITSGEYMKNIYVSWPEKIDAVTRNVIIEPSKRFSKRANHEP